MEPTDAVVRITLACVCGSDPHPCHSMDRTGEGVPMGHEFVGVVEETGSEVTGLTRGDFVVSPFAFAHNTCPICRDGFHTACPHGGWYGAAEVRLDEVADAYRRMDSRDNLKVVVRP